MEGLQAIRVLDKYFGTTEYRQVKIGLIFGGLLPWYVYRPSRAVNEHEINPNFGYIPRYKGTKD